MCPNIKVLYIYIYIFFFNYIIMKFPTIYNNINSIKEARELFNELRSNLSHEETKIKLFIIF